MKPKIICMHIFWPLIAIGMALSAGVVVRDITSLPVVALNEHLECEWYEDAKGRVDCPSELPRKYAVIHVISKERAATEVITYETKNYPR